jgi:hypothetical protein
MRRFTGWRKDKSSRESEQGESPETEDQTRLLAAFLRVKMKRVWMIFLRPYFPRGREKLRPERSRSPNPVGCVRAPSTFRFSIWRNHFRETK